MTQELSPEQQKVIGRVEKLLAMANRKKGNEAEAAVAAAKAQKMLAEYNLDMAMIEQGSSSSGKREDKKRKGGNYVYQRDLWRACAELNFCLYWTSSKWVSRKGRKRDWYGDMVNHTFWSIKYQHRVVGRTVNVKATEVLADYLEQAIERVLMDRLGQDNNQRFSNWAVSYRKGAAAEVIRKLIERRKQIESEQAQKLKEAQERAAASGASSGTALSLGDVKKNERDANYDHIYGEGWSAEQRRKAQERAEAAAKAEAEYAAWAAANPEEAAAEEKKRQEENERYWARRRGGRRSSGPRDNTDWGAFSAGESAGSSIGIDPQTGDGRGKTGRLG